jgi:hypothetical protein
MADYVSEILSRVSGSGGSGMYDDVVGDDDVVGLDDATEGEIARAVQGLVEVGALTEVGARKARKAMRRGVIRGRVASPGAPRTLGSGLPSPPFAMSGRDTERRAPLGFTEDGTGRNYFSLAASIGAITTMRAKVSRVSHVDRLLIVPSGAGVVIESIKVGDEEQTLASGVPVELYGASALTDTVPDNFSPIGPGLDFIIVLRNTTAAALTGTIGTKCACKR